MNVLGVQLDEALDEAGFRHIAASIGDRLGARRIGASVYEAEAGQPIWPYHYHHGIEEWLYVLEGAPILREPAGEQTLAPGDMVCFPSGELGAHSVKGPGRFVIFATGQHVEPWMSVYPDTDKVSGPEGIFLRSSAVGYWHGEGTAGPAQSTQVVRESGTPPPRPVVPTSAVRGETGDSNPEARTRSRLTRLGALLGADRLDGTVVELDRGAGADEYRYVHGREQWLLVMAGSPTLRHPHGVQELDVGDLVCLHEGPAGAHRLINEHDSVVRALSLSTTGLPAAVCYPSRGRWVLQTGSDDIILHEPDRPR